MYVNGFYATAVASAVRLTGSDAARDAYPPVGDWAGRRSGVARVTLVGQAYVTQTSDLRVDLP